LARTVTGKKGSGWQLARVFIFSGLIFRWPRTVQPAGSFDGRNKPLGYPARETLNEKVKAVAAVHHDCIRTFASGPHPLTDPPRGTKRNKSAGDLTCGNPQQAKPVRKQVIEQRIVE